MTVVRLVALEMTDNHSWRSLSTPINKASSEDALRISKSDYTVVLNPVYVWDPFQKKFVEVEDRYCTGRHVTDAFADSGMRQENWEVVKDRYVVVPNSDILERASSIADAFNGSAHLDSCGSLDNGRKFFVAIFTGTLEIIGSGDKDMIDTYVIAMTSHDGSVPVCYYNLDVRRRNNSVYRFFDENADFCIRKRHTPNHADRDSEVTEVLTMRQMWSTSFKATLQNLLSPLSESQFENVLHSQWNPNTASSKSKREHAENVIDTINSLYRSDYNFGMFGHSKWAAFNAICEYIDFHRDIPGLEAAQHSLEIDNFSHRLKLSLYKELRSI
jgi:hypothetical protein